MRSGNHSVEHGRLVRQALVRLFELQIRTGSSVAELSKLVATCISVAHKESLPSKSVSEAIDAQDYGTVLKTWHRHSKYLSKDGFPKPLGIGGRYGLRKLVQAYYPKDRLESVLGAMRSAGLVKQQADGKWLPSDKCAVFPRLNSELLEHLSEGVCRLIETVTSNVTRKRKEDVLFERSTKVRALPASDGLAFRRFVHDQASTFLSSIDDWLESRAEAGRSRRGKKCTAGVFTFAFMDDVAKKHAGRKARKRVVSNRN